MNPEPTFDEILKQERMPQNLEGYIDPIKMWVKYDGESKVPGALTDFLYLRKGFCTYSTVINLIMFRIQPRSSAGKEAQKGERCPSLPSTEDGLQHFAVQGRV